MRHNPSPAERKLWDELRSGKLEGLKFRRQQPIGYYIADFLCAESKVIIELDGRSHVKELENDLIRTAYLESRGYKVIRFGNEEVLGKIDRVLWEILSACENRRGL